MKKGTKLLALALSVLMVLCLFAGCNGNNNSSTASKPENSTPQSSAANKSSTADDTSSTVSTGNTSGDVTLPITEEKTTVSLFTTMDSNLTTLVDDFNETPFFQELEKRTNVHIDFDIPATGNETTAYNLLFASGELPDMVKNTQPGYPGGLDAAIDDGYFLDLTELVPQYAPNYWKVNQEFSEQYDENVIRSSVTGSGRIGAIGQIMKRPQGPWAGLYIRKDWLDECGLDVPVTYDDWEEVLTAFKDKMGATAPMLLGKTGYDSVYNVLSVGYGVTYSWYQEDGVVKYGPAQEGWRKYVTTLHDWYEKGLIDPDFMSATSPAMIIPDTALVTTNKTGLFEGIYTNVAMWEASCEDPDAEFVPIYSPMEKEGDVNHFHRSLLSIATATGGLCISAKSENVETCLKLVDYFFTEEGSLFCNYGVEGDTFEFDENGEPKFTEKMLNNPDGLTFAQTQAYYTMPPARTVWQAWDRELGGVPEKDLVSYDVWGVGDQAKSMPDPANLNIAPELYTEYSTIMTDVTTTVDEMTPQFISGVISLDEFDKYLETINSMKLARAQEIVQDAYDTFMATEVDIK